MIIDQMLGPLDNMEYSNEFGNKKLILIDIEKNPNISYETARSIQDKLMRNRRIYNEERRREWKERKELRHEEENIGMIVKAREEEIRTVKEIQKAAQERQLKREQIYVETLKKEEEERRRMEKKIEKEALIRAKAKKRRKPAKK